MDDIDTIKLYSLSRFAYALYARCVTQAGFCENPLILDACLNWILSLARGMVSHPCRIEKFLQFLTVMEFTRAFIMPYHVCVVNTWVLSWAIEFSVGMLSTQLLVTKTVETRGCSYCSEGAFNCCKPRQLIGSGRESWNCLGLWVQQGKLQHHHRVVCFGWRYQRG